MMEVCQITGGDLTMQRMRTGWIIASLIVLSGWDSIQAQESTAPPEPYLVENRSGRKVELSEVVSKLSACEVIFLGENHENDAGHRFQLQVIEQLQAAGHSLAISTEQFERDTQGVVDDYLAGRIDENQFLAAARPWKNYASHYRPIVEFAKAQRVPVLAANLPRHLAARISAGESIQPHEQVVAPRSTSAPEDRYWTLFAETMRGHLGADGAEKLQAFYRSQCAKDDAMAEAITDFVALHPHRPVTVVHLCGHFHSDYGLGTAARVVQRNPLLRTAIVTMEVQSTGTESRPESPRDRAHFTLWTIENPAPADH